MADEIDFKIIGDDMQAVIVTLDPGEMVLAEAGAMMYMQDGIVMNTTLDPSGQSTGLFGKLLGGAKRVLSGDSFFITTFANGGRSRQDVRTARPAASGADRTKTTPPGADHDGLGHSCIRGS